MREFKIMFSDLTEEAQTRLLETFETTPICENWDVFPISIIEREDDKDDETMVKLIKQQEEIKFRIKYLGNKFDIDVNDYIDCFDSYGEIDVYEKMTNEDLLKDIRMYNKNRE
jgi:hypothetical protein